MGQHCFGYCLSTLVSYQQYCSNDIVLKDTKQWQNRARQLLQWQWNLFISPCSSKNNRSLLFQTNLTTDVKSLYTYTCINSLSSHQYKCRIKAFCFKFRLKNKTCSWHKKGHMWQEMLGNWCLSEVPVFWTSKKLLLYTMICSKYKYRTSE